MLSIDNYFVSTSGYRYWILRDEQQDITSSVWHQTKPPDYRDRSHITVMHVKFNFLVYLVIGCLMAAGWLPGLVNEC